MQRNSGLARGRWETLADRGIWRLLMGYGHIRELIRSFILCFLGCAGYVSSPCRFECPHLSSVLFRSLELRHVSGSQTLPDSVLALSLWSFVPSLIYFISFSCRIFRHR